MARGFLKGAFGGGMTSLCAVGVASMVAEGPQAPTVTASAPTTNAAPEPAVTDAAPPRGDRVPVTGQRAPKAPAPQPDTLAAVREETVRPAAQPETGAATLLPAPGVDIGQSGIDTGAAETPVTSNPQALALQAPGAEPGVRVSTDPAQPPAPQPLPELALTQNPVQPAPPALEDGSSVPAPAGERAPEIAPADVSISVEPVQPPVPDVPIETQAFAPDARAEPETPPVEETPQIAQEAPAPQPARTERVVRDLPVPDAPQVSTRQGRAQALPLDLPDDTEEAPELAPQDVLAGIGRPAGTVGNLAPDVQINRLPSLRDDIPGATEVPAVPEATPPEVEPPVLDRPVARFAMPYENPQGKPLMAIVLMDDGVDLSRDTIGLSALRSFPYPISFAVNSNLPDARDRMAAYRAEGFEVLATVDLPQGAQASDAEVSLSVALEAVPEAVGVLEGVGEGVQGSRDSAQQVMDILAATGHGFVTQNKGLNTVQKLAAKAGVPSAVVFRDFDDTGQTPVVIRRFLDQAAFRAGRDGTVVMLGRLREDTISALLLWGLQDRAERVALVPVSAALTTLE